MSHLPGNPHYEDYVKDLDADAPYDGAIMQLHATLALAYEQRTANLLALFTAPTKDMTDIPQNGLENWLQLGRDIEERLGLGLK